MTGWINVASLILGLTAWVLPIVSMMRHLKHIKASLIHLSLVACASALFFQIWGFYERVKLEDWYALMDTASAITTVSAVLLIGTILLNIVACRSISHQQKRD